LSTKSGSFQAWRVTAIRIPFADAGGARAAPLRTRAGECRHRLERRHHRGGAQGLEEGHVVADRPGQLTWRIAHEPPARRVGDVIGEARKLRDTRRFAAAPLALQAFATPA